MFTRIDRMSLKEYAENFPSQKAQGEVQKLKETQTVAKIIVPVFLVLSAVFGTILFLHSSFQAIKLASVIFTSTIAACYTALGILATYSLHKKHPLDGLSKIFPDLETK